MLYSTIKIKVISKSLYYLYIVYLLVSKFTCKRETLVEWCGYNVIIFDCHSPMMTAFQASTVFYLKQHFVAILPLIFLASKIIYSTYFTEYKTKQNKKREAGRCLSVFLSFCLSVFLSFCLFVFLSFCLSVFLSFCLSPCFSLLGEIK